MILLYGTTVRKHPGKFRNIKFFSKIAISKNCLSILYDIVKRLSIPPSHAKVIFHLHCGGEASVSEIAKNLSISKSNMTPIIDKLIQENLVERFTDPNDRRIIRVRVTEKGHEFCLKQREKTKKHLEEKISSLSPDELERVKDLAKELNSIFSKI